MPIQVGYENAIDEQDRRITEIEAKIEGLQTQITTIDDRSRSQYDQLNRTFRLKLDLDYEDWQARKARQAEQDHRWQEWHAELQAALERIVSSQASSLMTIEHNQWLNRTISYSIIALIIGLSLLYIGARFL